MANKFTIWINDNVNLTGLGKVTKALGDIKDSAEKMQKAFKEGFEASKKAVDVFFAPLKSAAVPAIAAVTTAFGLLIKSVREWAGQELGEADVTSALVAMGQYTNQYRDQLIKLADTYQTTTGIADDMWLKSLGQLTRFGMNASNVDRVSEALKNLTGLMDGNLDGATDMLAKAMQGEFGMFSRYGIVIKQTGDQVKDLDAAITAINSKGVGLLEARANTLSGKWAQLKNQANEVFEAIGKKISSSLEIGAGIDKAKGLLATLTAAVQSGGLGDLIAKGGLVLKEHIEKAVKKAEEIATAISNSDKPLEVVFSDALRAAANVFVETLGTLITASLSIWKAVGIVIFNAFKEEFLALPIAAPLRHIEAARNFDNMTPQERQTFAEENNSTLIGSNGTVTGFRTSHMSDKEEARFGAKLASSGSSTEIANAIKNSKEEVKTAFVGLLDDLKAEVKKATGVTKDGKTKTGTSSAFTTGVDPVAAQQAYAEKMFKSGGVDPGAKSAAKESTITMTDASGKEVTRTLKEQIAEFKKTEEENAKTVETNTANAKKTAESSEASSKAVTEADTKATDTADEVEKTAEESAETLKGANKAVDESNKAQAAIKASHTDIETAMRAAATAAQQSQMVAQQTKAALDQVAATQVMTVNQVDQIASDMRALQAKVRSMC